MTIKSSLSTKEELALGEAFLREYQNPATIAPNLPARLLDNLATAVADLRLGRNDRIVKQEASLRATTLHHEAVDALILRLRHAFQLVKRKSRVERFPTSMILAYGLLSDGTYPKELLKLKQPVQTARDLIQAEQAAVAEGFGILTDPTTDELQTLIDAVVSLDAARSTAKSEEVVSVTQLQELRRQFNAVIKRLRGYLRFAMIDEDVVFTRRVMLALGFTYLSRKGDANATQAEGGGGEPTSDETEDDVAIPNQDDSGDGENDEEEDDIAA